MKKICLLLAVLLCCIPVLSACGAQSSAESVVTAALEARYVDFDYETMYELAHNYNVDLYKELLADEEDVLKSEKDAISSRCDSLKSTIKASEKAADKYDDYAFEYEIRYCKVYDEDDDAFDEIVKSSKFSNDGYSDMKSLIDEVAKARVVGEIIVTTASDAEIITNIDEIYTCYRIDGSWYIEWKDASEDTFAPGVDLGDLIGDLGDLGDLFG